MEKRKRGWMPNHLRRCCPLWSAVSFFNQKLWIMSRPGGVQLFTLRLFLGCVSSSDYSSTESTIWMVKW